MKTRLLPLDGLRGFAAISVVISHIGINLQPIVAVPLYNFFFRMISSGTTAVQLFFVLSGFLMAYLYPVVNSSFAFLGKRYLRIMPLYATVVLYIWRVQMRGYPAWKNFAVLIVLALLVNFLWKLIRRGKLIFIIFLLFQLVYLIVSLIWLPEMLDVAIRNLDNFQKNNLYMLSNLSMTMYLLKLKQLFVFNGVFWSLVPEMLFYIIYPFLVVPAVVWLNKQKPWLIFLVSAAVIKILFDLDAASRAFYSLQGIFICRASGFVIGIILGRVYLNQQKVWQRLEKFLSRPVVNLSVLVVFLTALGLEWPDRYYQIREYVAFHFLGLSVIFGLTLAAALAKNSLLGRLFSQKILVFLGMVSYSLYLIHLEVVKQINWLPFWYTLNDRLSIGWFNLIKILIVGGLCVGVSWLLYWLIERMYFISKKTALKPAVSPAVGNYFSKRILPAVIFAGLIIWIYSGDYSPSLILARHRLTGQSEKFEFTGKENNFGAVLLPLDFTIDPSIAGEETVKTQLVFNLYNNRNELIFSSRRSADQTEGQPMFPFGFPAQVDSRGKLYSAEIFLADARQGEEIHINKNFGMVTQYLTEKKSSVGYYLNLLYQRLMFVLSYHQVWLALALMILFLVIPLTV